eukprot:267543-Prymnesium_polylepis.1
MARVRDARTTRAGSHAEIAHKAPVPAASVIQGSGMGGPPGWTHRDPDPMTTPGRPVPGGC